VDRLTEQERQELEQQKTAIQREAAKLRELHDALEGAEEEVTPSETP
jgi:prefoldin subunit 5